MSRTSSLGLGTLVCLLLSAAPVHAATAWITISSVPPGAAVYIDGKELGLRGTTAAPFKIRLSHGTHKVLLELDGYKALEQTIQVSGKQNFVFNLERAPGKLFVRSSAMSDESRGAEIFVDGNLAGTLPREVELAAGPHMVEVRKPGYKVYVETVEMKAGETRTILVNLQAEIRKGSLLISAAEGQIYVDGQPRGPSPLLIELDEGPHQVEVRREGSEAPVFQKTVQVNAGQQTRVQAEIKREAQTGSLLVLAPADAEVIVDGGAPARANQEIDSLKPGQHVVVVQGRSYKPVTRIVDIEAGKQRVEKVELEQSAEARGVGVLRVIMVSPVEGAQYFINGRKVSEEQILSDKGMEVVAGQNVVVVRREGFGSVTKNVTVQPGGVETVTVELRNVGRVAVDSVPPGGQILIDGAMIGQTPFVAQEVQGGTHLVEVRLQGYQPFMQQVNVRGGEQVAVRAELMMAQEVPGGTRPESLASFSALVHDPGHFTVDLGGGYPYFIFLGITVGAVRKGMFGLDAGAEFRSSFYANDVGLRARAQLFRAGPVAGGLNLFLGGGGGPRQRNELVFEVGVPITLIAGRLVQLTARPYLQIYSDRLCPSAESIVEQSIKDPSGFRRLAEEEEHSGDRCLGRPDANMPMGYPNAVLDAVNGRSPMNDASLYQVDGTDVLARFVGVRFFLQAVLEISVARNANVWFILEGAPFQGDRQSYTDKFNYIFPVSDLPLYGRLGLTFKY